MVYSKGDYFGLNEEAMNINWESLFEGLNVENSYEVFLTHYNMLVEKFVPIRNFVSNKKFNTTSAKWFNNDIRAATKEKYCLFAKMRAASKSAAEIIRPIYNKKCREVKKLVKKSFIEFERKIFINSSKANTNYYIRILMDRRTVRKKLGL